MVPVMAVYQNGKAKVASAGIKVPTVSCKDRKFLCWSLFFIFLAGFHQLLPDGGIIPEPSLCVNSSSEH